MFGPIAYLGLLSSFAREPQPYERRYPSGHSCTRKVNGNKAVQRRRKHRAMTKAMRQMLRRR